MSNEKAADDIFRYAPGVNHAGMAGMAMSVAPVSPLDVVSMTNAVPVPVPPSFGPMEGSWSDITPPKADDYSTVDATLKVLGITSEVMQGYCNIHGRPCATVLLKKNGYSVRWRAYATGGHGWRGGTPEIWMENIAHLIDFERVMELNRPNQMRVYL